MMNCVFKVYDLASTKYYKIYKQDSCWVIFNEEGEGVELDLDVIYSIIDRYFKENI